jgi:hypothetical protein
MLFRLSHGWRTFLLALLTSCSLAMLAGCRGSDANLLRGKKPSSLTHVRHAERLTDGVRAVTGDVWNSNLASVMELGASIEWDLGVSEPISAAYLQGDHDDVYALLVSDDGRTWQTPWEATSVAADGQQPRMTRELTAHGRFVRLEPRGGDGFYSVSELALFRSPQGALPPPLSERIGDAEGSVERSELAIPLSIAALFGCAVFALGLLTRRVAARIGVLDRALLLTGVMLLVTITAFVYRARYRNNTIDDAYISFQYAKNWASGQGLVFNAGERVEGFSNFLWWLCSRRCGRCSDGAPTRSRPLRLVLRSTCRCSRYLRSRALRAVSWRRARRSRWRCCSSLSTTPTSATRCFRSKFT